jgi:uncharacterized membrane protein YidH (DUF202 family)
MMTSPEKGAPVILTIIIAVGVFAIAMAVTRALRHSTPHERSSSETDPLYTTGVTLTVTSVALVILLGPVMYAMMALGFIFMAIGARRMRRDRSRLRG